MSKCTKCGTVVDQPVKTWKIKQTPVALYECPSCKAKWRSKYADAITIAPATPLAAVVPVAVQATIPEPVAAVQTPIVTGRIDDNISIIEEIKTVADNIPEPEPVRTPGIFSGIRAFFTNLFST